MFVQDLERPSGTAIASAIPAADLSEADRSVL